MDKSKILELWIENKRIEIELIMEAKKLWYEKPKKERMRKVGLFRNEEDYYLRDQFIQNYVDTNFASRIN